jgi:COP9 signalosome complex subunit 6
MCDHYTRVINGGSKQNPNHLIMGLLFGTYSDSSIVIWDAIELIYNSSTADIGFLNFEQITRITSLLVAVYPKYELIGWYTVGINRLPIYTKIHQNFISGLNISKSFIFCILNGTISNSSKQLPISIYESNFTMDSNEPSLIFSQLTFNVETDPTEKMSIDQVTKAALKNGSNSTLESQNNSLIMSVLTLQSKFDCILRILSEMDQGIIPYDPTIVRKANSIINQLSETPSSEFEKRFQDEIEDCYLMTYLSIITKASLELKDLGTMQMKLTSSIGQSVARRGSAKSKH